LDKKPLISVITVVFNGALFLEKTIQSVSSQLYDNVEFIVVDGKSSDATVDLIKKYEDKIDCWVSEKDDGIFDAMNKGVGFAHGKYIIFMNAGDLFFDEFVINEIYRHCMLNYDVVYGDRSNNKAEIVRAPKKIFKMALFRRGICHQSTFIKKKAFLRIGMYDTAFLLGGDHDWLIRACLAGLKFKYVPIPICIYLGDGVSSNIIMQNEKINRLRRKYYNSSERMLYGALDILIRLLKRIINFDFKLPYFMKYVLTLLRDFELKPHDK